MKKIEIKIKDDNIDIKTTGFEGKSCIKEIDKLSRLTGLEVKERKFTSEAHQLKTKHGVKL